MSFIMYLFRHECAHTCGLIREVIEPAFFIPIKVLIYLHYCLKLTVLHILCLPNTMALSTAGVY